jgi:hypothetical protein
MWSGGTDLFPFRSCQLVFGRRTPLSFHQVLCFPLYNLFLSKRRNRYDVDHFSASLSCYGTSLKTCYQSTEIESRLWFDVPWLLDCKLWSVSARMLFERRLLLELSLCVHIILPYRANNSYDCCLLQNRSSVDETKQIHETRMFKSSETKCA